MPTVVDCPQCRRKLRVPDQLLGKTVKCPACQTVFTAAAQLPPRKDQPAPKEQPPGPQVETDPTLQLELDEDPQPARFSKRKGEKGESKPPKALRAKNIVDEDEDDDEDDRRSRRGADLRSEGQPHRGGMILTLGIISTVSSVLAVPTEFGVGLCSCCCVFVGMIGLPVACLFMVGGLSCGIPAIVMGQRDLRRMREGELNPSGRGKTLGGLICGIVGVALAAISAVVTIIMVAIYGMAFFAASTAPPSPSGAPGPFTPNPPPRKFSVEPRERLLREYLPSPE